MEVIIKGRAKRIVEEGKADLKNTMERTQKALDVYLESLDAASKVVLPVNLLDILSNGGDIDIFPLDKNHEDIEIRCGNARHYIHLERDVKYRVVTIVERI